MESETIKLGLYGCGNRTKALLNAAKGEENFEVSFAYDIRKDATDQLCKEFGGIACSSSAELVEAKDIDAFIISLDPFSHPKAFFETIEAGKPVFIEKPIAMEAQRAYEMMVAAKEKNINVQVGFMRRFNPGVQAAFKYLRENDPGKILSVTCHWFHAGETEMINMLKNCPDNFRMKVSQIPFHCCHALDVMILLGGNIKNVTSRGLKVIDRPYPSPDEVISSLEFENGAVGLFQYSSMAYMGGIDYLVHTENYTLAITTNKLTVCARPKYKYQRENFSTKTGGFNDCRGSYHKYTQPVEYNFPVSSEDPQIMLSFLDCVRYGKAMIPTLEEAWRVADFAETIENSFKENKTINLPATGK